MRAIRGSLVPLHTGKARAAGGVDPGCVVTLQVGAASEATALRIVYNSTRQALRLPLNALTAPAPLLGPGAVVAGGAACIGPLSVHAFRVVGPLVPAGACTDCRTSAAGAAGDVDKLLHLNSSGWGHGTLSDTTCAQDRMLRHFRLLPHSGHGWAAQPDHPVFCTLLLADTLLRMARQACAHLHGRRTAAAAPQPGCSCWEWWSGWQSPLEPWLPRRLGCVVLQG